jgi:hypothetical protein
MTTQTKTEFTSTGWDEYYKKLNEELTPKAIGDIIAEDIRDNPMLGIDFQGAPLKPLSTKRIVQKIERGFPYPEKPMFASGQLGMATESFEISDTKAEVRVNNNRFRTEDNPFSSITNIELLDKHQNTRPIWGMGEKTLKKIREFISDISKKIAGR